MQWTVRLEARTDQGEAEITELVTFSRPVVAGTLADLGLALSEAKAVLAKLQGNMVQSQAAEYVAYHRLCPHCRAIAEERRLFYVGVTCARHSLQLSWVRHRRDWAGKPSRFLAEIPKALMRVRRRHNGQPIVARQAELLPSPSGQ
jgi:hypothetical protein